MQSLDEKVIEPMGTRHRMFRYSINFLFFHHYGYSKTVKIKHWAGYIIPAVWYSLVTVFLGFWILNPIAIYRRRKNIGNSIEAIVINFSGGIDCNKVVEELSYSHKINYLWNNLLNATKAVLTRASLQIIAEIQDEYKASGKQLFSEENMDFINQNLRKISSFRVKRPEMLDIFDAMKLYDRYLKENAEAL